MGCLHIRKQSSECLLDTSTLISRLFWRLVFHAIMAPSFLPHACFLWNVQDRQVSEGTWMSLSSPANEVPTPAADLLRPGSWRPGAWEAEEPEKQLGLFYKELNALIRVNANVAAREKKEFFPSPVEIRRLREKEQVSWRRRGDGMGCWILVRSNKIGGWQFWRDISVSISR